MTNRRNDPVALAAAKAGFSPATGYRVLQDGLVFQDEEAAQSRAGLKVMRTTSLADSRSARFPPRLSEQRDEWQYVQDEMRQGRKLAQVYYGVSALSPSLGLEQDLAVLADLADRVLPALQP